MPLTKSSLGSGARDTVFLLSAVGWSIAPQSEAMPWWSLITCYACLLTRGYCVIRQKKYPFNAFADVVFGLVICAFLLQYGFRIHREAAVTMTALILCVKCLELSARRDVMVIFMLGFFSMTTTFLVRQDLISAVCAIVGCVWYFSSLTNFHLATHGGQSIRQASARALKVMVMGFPIAVALFVVFPRFSPLWSSSGLLAKPISGMSDRMQVGKMAELANDETVALRVRFDRDRPTLEHLYFRGPVLTFFDGTTWSSDRSALRPVTPENVPEKAGNTPIEYTLHQSASGQPWVFGLDNSSLESELTDVFKSRDMTWMADHALMEPRSFRMTASLNAVSNVPLSAMERRKFTSLPPGSNPLTRDLSKRLLAEAKVTSPSSASTQKLVDLALQHLTSGGYEYSLTPGVYGNDVADEFFFNKKRGFCEHVASAFAVLLRGMDVPVRIVTGYQGGELNAFDRTWVVRNSSAHAWNEVWMEEKGWVRVDPTPTLISGDIRGETSFDAGQVVKKQAGSFTGRWFSLFREGSEAIDSAYRQWVLNFSSASQDSIKGFMKSPGVSVGEWVSTVVPALLAVLLPSVLVHRWVRSLRVDPFRHLTDLARRHHGVDPYGSLVRHLAHDKAWHEWATDLERCRFGRDRDVSDARRLRRVFDRLRQS